MYICIQMGSHDTSEKIKRLMNTSINLLIERTGGDLTVSLKFVNLYNDACTKQGDSNDKLKTDAEIRQHVRENLLKNNYIYIDPNDVDSVYITQKTIEEYADHKKMQ